MAGKQLDLGFGEKQRDHNAITRLIASCSITLIFVIFTQFSLFLISQCFSSLSIFIQLALSASTLLLISAFGKCSRRLLRISASAPAFVFFNLIFIWGFYILVVRPAVSPLKDIALNGGMALLLAGFYSILSRDPGLVKHDFASSDGHEESSVSHIEIYSEALQAQTSGIHSCHSIEEGLFSLGRLRYCKICRAFVRGFDHHCPAFGNCIGENNHALFMALLSGFIMTEALYITSANDFVVKFQTVIGNWWEMNLQGYFAMSTMMFSLLQLLWQVVFLTWHIYCICSNIKTDEWINWKRYPEFQVIHQRETGQSPEIKFKNPYDKGVSRNLKEYLFARRD